MGAPLVVGGLRTTELDKGYAVRVKDGEVPVIATLWKDATRNGANPIGFSPGERHVGVAFKGADAREQVMATGRGYDRERHGYGCGATMQGMTRKWNVGPNRSVSGERAQRSEVRCTPG